MRESLSAFIFCDLVLNHIPRRVFSFYDNDGLFGWWVKNWVGGCNLLAFGF